MRSIPQVLALGFIMIMMSRMAPGQEILPPEAPYQEWFRREVPVAGSHVIKGVVSGKLLGQADPDSLYVCLPPGLKGSLHLEVTSLDGRYFGNARYSITGKAPGIYRLAVKSQDEPRRFLTALPRQDIAVLAYLEEPINGKQAIVAILPVFWEQARSILPDSLLIQLQSQAAVTMIAWPGKQDRNFGKCKSPGAAKVPEENPVAFNQACEIAHLTREQMFGANIVRNNLGSYLFDDLPIASCS